MNSHSHPWFWKGWLPVILLLMGLSACRSHGDSDPVSVARPTLPDSLQQVFDRLYLESVCQKLAGHRDAQYELLAEALRIAPEAPEALFEMAELLKLAPSLDGDTLHRTSDRLIGRVYALDSTNRDYAEAQAAILLEDHEYDAAVRIYRRLLEERYEEEMFHIVSFLYFLADDLDNMSYAFDLKDIHDGGATEESIYRRFWFMSNAADSAKAMSLGQSFVMRDTTSRTALDAYTKLTLGRQLDPTFPLERTRRMLRTAPHDPLLLQDLAILCQIRPETTDEYRTLLDSLMLDPAYPSGNKAAIVSAGVEKPELARVPHAHILGLMEQALQQPQDDPTLWQFYLDMKGDSIDPEMAYRGQLQILSYEPYDTDLRMKCLAQALVRESQTDTALDICQGGITYTPDFLVFPYYAAVTLYSQDRTTEAIGLLVKGLEQAHERTKPEFVSEAYAILGDMYHEQGDTYHCFAAYDSALVYNPSNYACMNNYAYFLQSTKSELDRAEEMAQRVIEAEPGNAIYLDTYAWILYQKRQYTQARIYIDQAIRTIETTDMGASVSVYYDHAGDIYFHNRLAARAVELWKKALQYSNDEDEQARLRIKISRRRP